MEQQTTLFDRIGSLRPTNTDLLRYLRSTRKFLGDKFCSDEAREWTCRYAEDEFWGSFDSEVPRDEDGYILEDVALEWTKSHLEDFYAEGELAPFVRTMMRTEALKEELMMAAWHPRRIGRILELGGHEALDNFAGI
jgi:hypothetical protein